MNELTITDARAYEYLMPFRKAFGTARSISRSAQNVIVHISGNARGSSIVGLGESAPRGERITGDVPADSWSFLSDALESLVGTTISLADHSTSVDGVRAAMTRISALATRSAGPKAFRGMRSGIDMALLDMVARSHAVSVADLLGRRRTQPSVSAATINTARTPSQVDDEARRHLQRFPILRVKTTGDLDDDLDRIGRICELARSIGVDKPIWADFNEGLSTDTAAQLVDRLATGMRRGAYPRRMIIEQPVAKAETEALAMLQSRADRAVERHWFRRRGGEIVIMADESLWDQADAVRLHEAGGCRAVNIKIQKVGGILAAHDLAEQIHRVAPETELYIGGMIGTSDITGWSITNLLMALPRLDYNTTVPHGNVERRIAEPQMRYVSKTSNELVAHEDVGHGATVVLENLVPYVTRTARAPRTESPSNGLANVNRFDLGHLTRFSKLELDSHLLEVEALARGLHTERLSPKTFFARAPEGGPTVGFQWSTSTHTMRTSFMVAGNKQATRSVLSDAGVPCPIGRRFSITEIDAACEFATQLGWPVVVKPTSGGGGSGVTTNIGSTDELTWAVGAIDQRKYQDFVVEQHVDGDDYRLLVVGDRVVSAVHRVPAHVVGDGIRTIADLIIAKNLLRRTNPHLAARLIRPDERTRFQLERQGFELHDVPSAGTTVWLSTAGNISQGGDSYEVLDDVHPSILDVAVRAIHSVPGLPAGGVDLLLEDHRLPLENQSAAVCELNSSPATTSHHFPMVGPPRNASEAVLLHSCELSGMTLGPRTAHISVGLTVSGEVRGVGFRRWMQRLAEELELVGWVKNPIGDDTVEATVSGPTERVAALVGSCMHGPPAARPSTIATRPLHEPLTCTTFEIV